MKLLSSNKIQFMQGFSKSLNKNYSTISQIDRNFFQDNGYLVLKDFFSNTEINSIKDEMNSLIDKQDPKEIKDIFKADMNFISDYFLSSGDKIRYFLENDSYDEKGNLKYPFKSCINKVGHGMHDLNPVFKKFSYSPQIMKILKNLGYKAPSIVQSMYILKGKRIGGEVTPHTDNCFIRSNPLSCLGIWVALDDATIENGALYGVPGSHKKPFDYFMKRTTNEKGQVMTTFTGEKPDYDLNGSVSLEAKKGTVVVLHGDFVHYSKANSSDKERHAYTLHCVETHNSVWEKDNWLLRPENNPFTVIDYNNFKI